MFETHLEFLGLRRFRHYEQLTVPQHIFLENEIARVNRPISKVIADVDGQGRIVQNSDEAELNALGIRVRYIKANLPPIAPMTEPRICTPTLSESLFVTCPFRSAATVSRRMPGRAGLGELMSLSRPPSSIV